MVRVRPSTMPAEELVNTSVETFGAYLALHRRLLNETAVLDKSIQPVSDTKAAPQHGLDAYSVAVNEILDRTEQDMRRLDPSLWSSLTGTRRNYGRNVTGTWLGYWPEMLGEFGEFVMWDGEEVLALWMTDTDAVT